MNKKEFIAALLEMFPNSFTQGNTKMWVDAYSKVLPENIDFQELFDDMLVNYKATNYAPSTAFFKPYVDKQLERIKEQNEKRADEVAFNQYLAEKRELTKNDKPMTNPILSPLELLKEKGNPYNGQGFFTDSQMKLFKNYVRTITMENLRIKFWQQVISYIGGNRNELCRKVQAIC